MKKKYFMLAALVVVLVVFVSLNVYAEKELKVCKMTLPEAVTAAIQSLYPQAEIQEVEKDQEGIMLYEIEVQQNGMELELSIAPDGIVVEEEQEIAVEDLPQAIQDAIAGKDVEEAVKEVTYYVVTLTKLDTPETSYEVELKQNGRKSEIEFAPDGTVLKQEMNDDDDDDDDHDGDDDDDDDDD